MRIVVPRRLVIVSAVGPLRNNAPYRPRAPVQGKGPRLQPMAAVLVRAFHALQGTLATRVESMQELAKRFIAIFVRILRCIAGDARSTNAAARLFAEPEDHGMEVLKLCELVCTEARA